VAAAGIDAVVGPVAVALQTESMGTLVPVIVVVAADLQWALEEVPAGELWVAVAAVVVGSRQGRLAVKEKPDSVAVGDSSMNRR
jgi:hypothetical protein